MERDLSVEDSRIKGIYNFTSTSIIIPGPDPGPRL